MSAKLPFVKFEKGAAGMAIIEQEPAKRGAEQPQVQEKAEPDHPSLLRAAEYLKKHGWCQGKIQDGDKACVLGALGRSGADVGEYYRLAVRLRDSLGLKECHHIGFWNDHPERTKEQVVEALERAAWGL